MTGKRAREEAAPRFTRREGQILDILYRLEEASVAEIMAALPNPPTDGAVRRMLNLLHEKGAIAFRHEGPKKIYRPTTGPDAAGVSALRHVVRTFFAGSAARTMASLFEDAELELPREDRRALRRLIDKARERGDGR